MPMGFKQKMVSKFIDNTTSSLNIKQNSFQEKPAKRIQNVYNINNILKGQKKDSLYKRSKEKCYHITKPILDITISFILLLFSIPIFIVSAPIIKLTSKGPVFYTQVRVGKNGQLFRIIKLRTMFANSENKDSAVWAKNNDDRVTKFGRFLRKTHIDELPQIINVIKGDMSIIGPRPERPVFVNRFIKEIPGYNKRLAVKPGITGMAQCYYKYDENFEDVCRKLRYDVLPIRPKDSSNDRCC